jgi:hypothetical protein
VIGLDEVPCPIEFTMRELAEISLAAADVAVDLTNPQLRNLIDGAKRDLDTLARIQVLLGIVRKIDDSIKRVGDAARRPGCEHH